MLRGVACLATLAMLLLLGAPAALLPASAGAVAPVDQIYWGNEGGPVRVGNLDGTGTASDVFAGETPCGVAIDPAAGKIYWASWNTGLIRVGNLDGTGSAATEFSDGGNLCGVAIDPAAGKIYWANFSTQSIRVGNLDGSGSPSTLFTEPSGSAPSGVAIDPGAGKIYWTNQFADQVRVGNLDGSGSALTLFGGEDNPIGVAIDAAADKLYWTDLNSGLVRSGNLDGTGAVTLFNSTTPGGVAIDPTANKIYWVSWQSGLGVRSGNLDGTGTASTLFSGESSSLFVALLRAPMGTAPPAISSGVGEELSCSQGSWAPDLLGAFLFRAPRSFVYQWLLGGSEIVGATASTFTPTEPGDYTCRVTASNHAGSASQTSAAFVVVAGLSIVKTAGPATYDAVGDVISYSYVVKNTGNVTLSGLFSVNDDKATDELCPVTASLAPGAFITCTASYSITQADLDAGSVTNVASATNGTVISPTDDETVTAVQNPALSIVKTATPTTYSAVGNVISYSYVVKNTGNVTLSGLFTVDDDKATDEFCPVTASLTPGDSITCTASYTIILADLNNGSVTNIAFASGGGVTSPTDTETVTAVPPKLTVAKVVVNTGGGTKGVSDFSLFVDSTGVTSGVQITSTTGSHTVGEAPDADYTAVISGDCAASGAITLAAGDVKSCTITNTFKVLAPGLKITKSASPQTIAPYQSVIYTYIVTNTGGTALAGIVVNDDNGTPGFAGDDFTVGTVASLAAGASATLTATVIPVVSTVGVVNGSPVTAGAVIVVTSLGNGDIQVTYLQAFGINDNTYGTGAIGWPKGHKFTDLTGSDKLEFRFFDKAGNVVLDFYQDYLTASTSFASGYGSLCATGGDGSMVSGSAASIVGCSTSLADNLNATANVPNKAALIVNSPAPTGTVSGIPTRANWNYVNSYTAVVKASTFTAGGGFGSVAVPDQHNSPNKLAGPKGMTTRPTNSTVVNTATAAAGTLTATATATVSIVVPPTAPVAVGDSYKAKKNTKLTVAAPGVLANDTDANGDPLTAVLVSNVSAGTLVLSSNGSFTYMPASNFTGKVTFTYQANDATASSNVATVTITVSK